MNKSVLLILISGLLGTQSISKSTTDSLAAMGWTDAEIIEWMESNQSELNNSDDKAFFETAFQLSERYANEGSYEKALELVSASIGKGEELGLKDGVEYRDAVNDKAEYLMELGRVKTAERWVRQHIEKEVEDWRYIKLCFFYSWVLETLGDLNLAESYLEKAFRISRTIEDDRYASRSLVRLSLLYTKSANLKSMLELYGHLDTLDFVMQPVYKTTISHNLSSAFIETGQYKKAYELALNVIQYGRETDQDAYVMYGLYHKAFAERMLGMDRQAMETFKETARYTEMRAKVYNNLAEMHIDDLMPDSAIYYSEKALQEAGYPLDQINDDYIRKALASPDKHFLLTYIHDLGRALILKGKLKEAAGSLEQAVDLFELLDRIVDELRMTTTEHKSRQFWRGVVRPIYEDAIEAAYLLKDFDKAFYFAEKSKAVLLLDDLVRNTSIRKGNVPDSLLNKEYRIQQEIINMEFELQESTAQASKDSLSDELLELKLQLNAVVQIIASVAPQYAKVKYKPSVTSMNDLKKIYKGKNIAVSFIWTNDHIYRFMVGNDNATVVSLEIGKAFNDDLRLLQQDFQRPLSDLTEISNLNAASSRIFRTILSDLENAGGTITIFPDGLLYFLPFEALVINDNPANPRYLIQDYVVHYGYSVNTNFEGHNRVKNRSILLFAPQTYAPKMKLSPLSYYDHEMEPVIGARTVQLKGVSANKENLLNGMGDKKIIHIYSHAAANDTSQPYPWIAAQDERIYLPEIYNQRVTADLVVLSACETNLGEEVKGEGIISLARGFFHAGSGSVLASMWSVNDRSNSEIVHHFYRYLKKGNTKAEAIRLSKLHYIKTHKLEAMSPYYWAAVVYIGEDGKLALTGHNWWKYLLYSLSLVGLAGLGLYTLRSNKAA